MILFFFCSSTTVKFGVDGYFMSSNRECSSMQQCLWSAYDGKLFVMMSETGLYRFTVSVSVFSPDLIPGVELFGKRELDGQKLRLDFSRVFDNTSRENALDLYLVLKVSADSDFGEIKKSYRRLMLELHPDQNPHTATEFNLVSRANEILSDPTKRMVYDIGGMEAIRLLEKGEFPKGQSVLLEVPVSLKILYTGGQLSPNYRRRVVCRGCRNTNNKGDKCVGCSRCPSEVKMVNQQVGPGFFVQQQVQVDSKEFCKFEETALLIDLPRGTKPDTEFVKDNMGEQRAGSVPGDVIVRIKQQLSGSGFVRKNSDLFTTIQVTVFEALLGFNKQILHLDDSPVVVANTRVTQPSETLLLSDFGMPTEEDDEFGNMYVEVKVVFPSKLSPGDVSKILSAFPENTTPSYIKA